MKGIYLYIVTCLLIVTQLKSQQPNVLVSGKIEFEKKLNLHSRFNDDDSWTAEFKKRIPQFKTTYFDLSFMDNKTMYQPGRDNVENNKLWEEPSEDNIVYTDFDKRMAISQKAVFEKTFLIQDTARRIKWKITDEKRTIAGLDCRRANAIIMDSLYVVAFYTDDIATPGGPESFNGLPGMILGLAIPHEHVTWFATKIYASEPVNEASIKPPVKGVKTTNAGLLQNLRSNLKNWGKYGERYIKAAML